MASRVLGAFAVTATAALASLALATPASAHTDNVTAKCDPATQKSTLTVGLTLYGHENRNTLEVTIDGKTEPKITFGREIVPSKKWELDGKVAHTYKVAIKAYDDPDGKHKWTKTYDLTTEACGKPEQPKPEQPKPEEPKPEQPKPEQPEVPSSSVTPPTTTTSDAPAPGGSQPEPPLAATGASPLWLLLSGVGLVGAGAATVLFVRRRRA